MILDGLLMFSGTFFGGTTPPAITQFGDRPTTGTQVSSNVLDLGIGSAANPAIPAPAQGGGARDLGIGDDPSLKLLVEVVTAITGGTSLAVALQGAPDNGSAAPGSFTTMTTGPVVAEASLIQGCRLLDQDVPRPVPGQPIPRFLQLQYTSVGTHSAGELRAFIVLDRHDLPENANAILSGYPAGINVAN